MTTYGNEVIGQKVVSKHVGGKSERTLQIVDDYQGMQLEGVILSRD